MTDSKEKLVSIIIPVYNGANYLREAIDSALAQTYPNIEVIVINDGSDDDGATERIAKSYGEGIRYFRKENGGVSSALNYGISVMHGECFSWLSHDDVYLPDKIESEIKALQILGAKKSIVKCKTSYIDKYSKLIKKKKDVNQITTVDEPLLYSIKHTLNGCSLLIPKEAIEHTTGFDESLRYCQDVLMWWKLFIDGYGLIDTGKVGMYSRIHNQQLTNHGKSIYKSDAKYIADIIIPEFTKISREKRNYLYEYARGEAIHGNRNIVYKCLSIDDEDARFSFWQRIKLNILLLFSLVRPAVRSLYYLLCEHR